MRVIALAAVLILLAVVGACGKFQPAEIFEKSALTEIRARGEVRVVTLNLPTCYYLGAQGTEGLEFDLATAYAAYLGVKLQMVPVANERALQAELAAGRADIAAASLTNTPEWSRVADAAEPYTLIPQLVVYHHSGVKPRETLQLESATLAVRAGSPQERILQRLKSTVAPTLKWEETAPSVADPVEDVETGEAQYAITDEPRVLLCPPPVSERAGRLRTAGAAPGAVAGAPRRAGTLGERQQLLPPARRLRTIAADGAGVLG